MLLCSYNFPFYHASRTDPLSWAFFSRCPPCALQLDTMRARLKHSMSNSREFAIFGKSNEPIVCSISIDLHADRTITVVLEHTDIKILHSVPLGFGEYINATPGLFVEDYQDVICVMMDIAGSTQFASGVEPRTMAELMHNVYKTVNDVVLREVFPFAYIHEIVGDSVLLIVNAGFMVCSTSLSCSFGSVGVYITKCCALLTMWSVHVLSQAKFGPESAIIAVHAASQIQTALDRMLMEYSEDMYARVGISMGDVCAGVMDGRSFRVFGETVHLSQRLEAACPRRHIACQSTVYQLLEKQLPDPPESEQVQRDLKGFGSVNYDLIPATRCTRCLSLHFCQIRQSTSLSPAGAEDVRQRMSRF